MDYNLKHYPLAVFGSPKHAADAQPGLIYLDPIQIVPCLRDACAKHAKEPNDTQLSNMPLGVERSLPPQASIVPFLYTWHCFSLDLEPCLALFIPFPVCFFTFSFCVSFVPSFIFFSGDWAGLPMSMCFVRPSIKLTTL